MATIVVKHQIRDAEKFFSLSNEVVGNAPEGLRACQFCPSQDESEAVCMWEGNSVDSLREYLDSVAPDAVDNAYFVIDEARAFGLPDQAPASA